MKLIVGLGNPGKEYINTRHNIGFMAIDSHCEKNNLSFISKFKGLYTKDKINNEDIIFLKPQKYMNLSGIVIKKYIEYFKIDINDILVIYDDKDFELGKIKIKPDGSSGGHNGIKNIIENLNTSNFKRIRVGISNKNVNLISYVLGKFTKKELGVVKEVVMQINEIIIDFVNLSFENLMNKYNK